MALESMEKIKRMNRVKNETLQKVKKELNSLHILKQRTEKWNSYSF